MARINARLDRLESSRGAFGDIIALIRQGAYYDEISPEQRQQYAAYWGVDDITALENAETTLRGSLHFPLIERKRFKSERERQEHIKHTAAKIEEIIQEIKSGNSRRG